MNANSSPSSPRPNREAIEATAGVWLSLRDRGMSARETEAFVRWLQEDPEHSAVFGALEETWQQLDQLGAIVAPGAAANPETLAPRYHRRLARLPMVSLAAAAALVLLCIGFWTLHSPKYFAETAVGAFQRVDLPDGSVAQLNTDSALDVDMSGAERRVRLVRGEVHFIVRKDSRHPFLVTAGDLKVRAVGTAFDVRREPGATAVIVTEGVVQVTEATSGRPFAGKGANARDSASVKAGECLVIPQKDVAARAPSAVISPLSSEELRRALAWQERRLEFDETPLQEVVAELNRYNRVKLNVLSPRLATRPFSGTFRVDGYEALVTLLQENFDVAVVRRGNDIQLREK